MVTFNLANDFVEHDENLIRYELIEDTKTMRWNSKQTWEFCGASQWYGFTYSFGLRTLHLSNNKTDHQQVSNFLRKAYVNAFREMVEMDRGEIIKGDVGVWLFEIEARPAYRFKEALNLTRFNVGVNANSDNKWRWMYIPITPELYDWCVEQIKEYEKEH